MINKIYILILEVYTVHIFVNVRNQLTLFHDSSFGNLNLCAQIRHWKESAALGSEICDQVQEST